MIERLPYLKMETLELIDPVYNPREYRGYKNELEAIEEAEQGAHNDLIQEQQNAHKIVRK
jgi:hypothetical protein